MTEYRDPDPEWDGEEAAALYAAINAQQAREITEEGQGVPA